MLTRFLLLTYGFIFPASAYILLWGGNVATEASYNGAGAPESVVSREHLPAELPAIGSPVQARQYVASSETPSTRRVNLTLNIEFDLEQEVADRITLRDALEVERRHYFNGTVTLTHDNGKRALETVLSLHPGENEIEFHSLTAGTWKMHVRLEELRVRHRQSVRLTCDQPGEFELDADRQIDLSIKLDEEMPLCIITPFFNHIDKPATGRWYISRWQDGEDCQLGSFESDGNKAVKPFMAWLGPGDYQIVAVADSEVSSWSGVANFHVAEQEVRQAVQLYEDQHQVQWTLRTPPNRQLRPISRDVRIARAHGFAICGYWPAFGDQRQGRGRNLLSPLPADAELEHVETSQTWLASNPGVWVVNIEGVPLDHGEEIAQLRRY